MRCLALVLAVFVLACGSSSPPAAPTTTRAPTTTAPARGLDPLLANYAYPDPVAFHEVTSQRQTLRMAYVDVAPPSSVNAPVVLLLHGKNFSAASWSPTIRALVERDFRVIAPDQIGFGKSDKPDRYQFSFEALVDATRSLLDARGVQRVRVVGHSMGGMLAVRFARMLPDRVDRLVLVNPIGLEDWRALGVPSATIDDLYAKELAATPDSIRTYMRNAYFAGEWKPAYEPLIEILAGWTQHPDYARVAWNAALTADMIFTQPVVHELPRVTAPTLLVIGTRDRTAIGKDRAPKDLAATLGHYEVLGKQAAAAIPGAKLVELDGVGHLPQVEAWDAYLRALLDFLGEPAGAKR